MCSHGKIDASSSCRCNTHRNQWLLALPLLLAGLLDVMAVVVLVAVVEPISWTFIVREVPNYFRAQQFSGALEEVFFGALDLGWRLDAPAPVSNSQARAEQW